MRITLYKNLCVWYNRGSEKGYKPNEIGDQNATVASGNINILIFFLHFVGEMLTKTTIISMSKNNLSQRWWHFYAQRHIVNNSTRSETFASQICKSVAKQDILLILVTELDGGDNYHEVSQKVARYLSTADITISRSMNLW